MPKKTKNIEPGSPNWSEEGDAWIYTCIKRSTYFFVVFSIVKKHIAAPTRRAVFTRFFVKKSFFSRETDPGDLWKNDGEVI
jgi:hypothetical protein